MLVLRCPQKKSYIPSELEKKEDDKTRPMIVKLNKEKRDQILENGKIFATNTQIKVAPDLTLMQRNQLNKLFEEAKVKNEALGNYEWKVVGPRDTPRLKVHTHTKLI